MSRSRSQDFGNRFESTLTNERQLRYKFIEKTWENLQTSLKRKRTDDEDNAKRFKSSRNENETDLGHRVLPFRKAKSLGNVTLENCLEKLDKKKEKCKYCQLSYEKARNNKFVSDLPNPKKEKSVLENEDINLFSDEEKVQAKLTSYFVYDEAGHMCSFDNNLIENGVTLYVDGYVKPIHSENPDVKGGVPIKQIGPLTCWWIAGFDGGEKAILGLSSDTADYYLLKPHEKYEPFLKNMKEKMYMVKLVIEFLNQNDECDATYENLLYKLQVTVPPPGFITVSEENLLAHAKFVYDLVISYDSTADSSERLFVNTPCMKSLAELSGISFQERLNVVQHDKRKWAKRNNEMTKAATTNLVENVFDSFFHEQLDKSINYMNMLRPCSIILERCDIEPVDYDSDTDNDLTLSEEAKKEEPRIRDFTINLKRLDLNKKEVEKEKISYGTPFSIVLDMLDSEIIEKKENDDDEIFFKTRRKQRKYEMKKSAEKLIHWDGVSVETKGNRVYYKKVILPNCEVEIGSFVVTDFNIHSKDGIGRVISLWDENYEKKCHIRWFINSQDTVLGEIGNPKELFQTTECDDVKISAILEVINVAKESKSDEDYFFQKRYDAMSGRFEDLREDEENLKSCSNCKFFKQKRNRDTPKVDEQIDFIKSTNEYSYSVVRWRDEEYRVGTCVFLQPGVLFPPMRKPVKACKSKNVDEKMYPELYRKKSNGYRTSDDYTAEPFNIGYILSISAKKNAESPKDISLHVRKFCRPQDTHLSTEDANKLDLNLLYWSNEESKVDFSQVEGKCYVAREQDLMNVSIDIWSKEGPYRFYYEKAYNVKDKKFYDLPKKTNSKNKQVTKEPVIEEHPIKWPHTRPLRCLDVFAGCGGLTEGLHQAGIAESRWAIEKEEAAAHAYRLNYPQATVFTDDCNELLKLIMNGQQKKNGQTLPQKGDVELLCGGPPCQGFSGMNRFNYRQYSCFKNSLVVSFLSYVDYYRPRYVLMENVKNFLSFKKHIVLKLTLRCLIKMGYQCTFGVAQAGCFGVPQCRRRAIIFAAAPGEILPSFPEPSHAFPDTIGAVNIDNEKFFMNINWTYSAPYRMNNVRDAISDLPEFHNSDLQQWEMPYKQEAQSHFQRVLRKSNSGEEEIVRDHVCRQLNALVEKRMSLIPRRPGSDWRDLPNIVVELSDGTFTRKLIYSHNDIKNGKSRTGAFRGVCSCASGKSCRPEYRQNGTIIPWCLPHTGNRHGNWSGLYGRLEWNAIFNTVVTSPEPMGKQGKVLHPEQDRVVSVREVARSQGFPDCFRFFGSVGDRYRQIGNAVPPPLAAALGREILKSVVAVEMRNANIK